MPPEVVWVHFDVALRKFLSWFGEGAISMWNEWPGMKMEEVISRVPCTEHPFKVYDELLMRKVKAFFTVCAISERKPVGQFLPNQGMSMGFSFQPVVHKYTCGERSNPEIAVDIPLSWLSDVGFPASERTFQRLRRDLARVVVHEWHHLRQCFLGELVDEPFAYEMRPTEHDAYANEIAYGLVSRSHSGQKITRSQIREAVRRHMAPMKFPIETRRRIERRIARILQGTGWLEEEGSE